MTPARSLFDRDGGSGPADRRAVRSPGTNSFRAACWPRGAKTQRRILHDRDAAVEFWHLRPARRARTLDAIGQIIYTCENGNGPGRAEPDKGIRIEMAQGSGTRSPHVTWLGPERDDLDYNIYLDATHRTVWGDWRSGTD